MIILLYLFSEIVWSLIDKATRISNGLVYPRKRFLPSENRFQLDLQKCRDRLRCIKLCQESVLCRTIVYDRKIQECILFSEHLQYGFGRLHDENNENLVTIQLDKDSMQDLPQTIRDTKNREKQSSTFSPFYQMNDENTCKNCEL